MILPDLFLTFFKIGAVSFGGGYGMLSLMREECCLAHDWLTEAHFLDFVAVAESTPGPIAVNMATFVGSSQAGLGGALIATLGVILPAFLILLLISALFCNLLKFPVVGKILSGIRPTVVGLIIATALIMGLGIFLGISTLSDPVRFDWRATAVFLVCAAVSVFLPKCGFLRLKKVSPIALILLSAVLGVLLY